MDFRLLGPLEVHDGDRLLDLGGSKQRAMLALLLLNANEFVSREALVDGIWGNDAPASASPGLKVYVSRLRKLLGAGDSGARLVTQPGGYSLEIDPERIDASRFERLCAEGHRALDQEQPDVAAARLVEALNLWRGQPAEDLDATYGRAEARRLEEMRLAALADKVEAELALGAHSVLVAELETLVAEHPFDERFRKQLMLALYRSGRRADALEVYRDTRRLLVDELGMEPGDDLRALEKGMLSNDPSLQGHPPTSGANGAAPSDVREARPRALAMRKWALAGAAVLALGAAAAVLATRGSPGSVAVHARSIGVLDPTSDRFVADVPLGTAPRDIAVGRSVWAATEARTLVRLDASSRTIVQTFDLDSTPTGVELAGGAAWVLQLSVVYNDVKESLARADPRFGDVTATIDTHGGDFPIDEDGLAAGGGALWVSHTGQPGILFRASPRTGRVTKKIPLASAPDSGSASATVVGAGSVWVTQGGGDLLRVSAVTGAPQAHISLGDDIEPVALAAGDGAVWVASRARLDSLTGKILGTGTVTRVDPRTNAVVTIRTGGTPAGIAAGDGAVWVTDQARRRVIKIDASSNQIVRRIDLDRPPSGVAFGHDLVWVGVR